jgi:hypothetical protein
MCQAGGALVLELPRRSTSMCLRGVYGTGVGRYFRRNIFCRSENVVDVTQYREIACLLSDSLAGGLYSWNLHCQRDNEKGKCDTKYIHDFPEPDPRAGPVSLRIISLVYE